MEKRYFVLPLVLTPCLAQQIVAQNNEPQRPNVVFIYADDIGFGDFSCNGAKTIHTPNVDRAAAQGVRFTNAHSAAATSTPSRYAMLTANMPGVKPEQVLPMVTLLQSSVRSVILCRICSSKAAMQPEW